MLYLLHLLDLISVTDSMAWYKVINIPSGTTNTIRVIEESCNKIKQYQLNCLYRQVFTQETITVESNDKNFILLMNQVS